MSGAGAANRLVDDVLGHVDELGVLGLADLTRAAERFVGGAAGTTPQQTDRLVDDGPTGQRALQLHGQRDGLSQDLGIVNGYGGGRSEKFTEFGGVIVEDTVSTSRLAVSRLTNRTDAGRSSSTISCCLGAGTSAVLRACGRAPCRRAADTPSAVRGWDETG